MIQEINLYQPIFRKEKPVLHAVSLAYITIAAILIFFGLGIGLKDQLAQQEKSLASQERMRDQLNEQLTLMQQSFKPKEKDPALPVKIGQLEMQLEQKRALVSRLSVDGADQKQGFSMMLSGLARQVHDGIWLREIELKAGGSDLVLNGSSLAPELIPEWIAKLRNEPAFVGKEFNYVAIREVGDLIEFSIATHRPQDLKNKAEQWLNRQKTVAANVRDVNL